MNFLLISLVGLLSLFSTAVMSYISMATPIGPWIAPTLILFGLLLFSFVQRESSEQSLVYATIAGSIGGILATAFGFSFPTLYFLDQRQFNAWMDTPSSFMLLVTACACIAGWYGMFIANLSESFFLKQDQLPFPIGQMIYKMIAVHKQIQKAWHMLAGFLSTFLFCMLQDGFIGFAGQLPKALTLCTSYSYYCFSVPAIHFQLWPMLWAIGFITGNMVVVPLLIGSFAKIGIVQPIQTVWFPAMTSTEFVLAFCSGIVVSGVLSYLMPSTLKKLVVHEHGSKNAWPHLQFSRLQVVEGVLLLIALTVFFHFFGFSLIAQLYIILFTALCTYQIIRIAGKIGLAQLGRFATFVLIPALFLFNLNAMQITIISTFVEAAAGVAVDVLFGRKVVQLSGVDHARAKMFQYVGLVISSIALGVIFWLLINHFGLGTPALFAQRSQARQLLIQVKSFNYLVVLIGIVFALMLKQLKLSPMLVLGGLLMPLNMSLGLVAGGLLSLCFDQKDQWYPLWSGVFAANSIWMILQALGSA